MRAGPKVAPTPNRASDVRDAQIAAHTGDQRAAARVVASRATGVDDCCDLLGMLGLSGVVGLPVVDPPARD